MLDDISVTEKEKGRRGDGRKGKTRLSSQNFCKDQSTFGSIGLRTLNEYKTLNNRIERFEDLNVWKEGLKLAISIHQELKDCKNFGLRDQIQRAAVSIPSNIAEGFERKSNKDFIRFLYYSKSSSGELRTQLYLCRELGLISKDVCNMLIEHSRKVSGMTYNLIKTRHTWFS